MGPRSGGTHSVKKNRDDPGKGLKSRPLMKPKNVTFSPTQLDVEELIQSKMNVTVTNTQNRFVIGNKPLSDYDMHDTSGSSQNKNKNQDKSDDNTKKTRNSPIIIVGNNVSRVQNICDEVVKSKKFQIKLLTIGVRVDIIEKKEFDDLCKYLSDEKIPHYMYHTSDSRPRKIVLYGLHRMEIDDLKSMLASNNITPSDITMLRLKQNRYIYDDQAVYLLYFKPGTVKLSDLRQIRHIDNIIVKWEPYEPRSRNIVPQCRNCQMFGHSSEKCNMPTKCLVCAQNHKTDDCKNKISRAVLAHKKTIGETIDTSYVKCANCQGNHPASYAGCIARQTYVNVQNKIRRPKQRRPEHVYRESEFPELPQLSSRNASNRPTFSSVSYQQPDNSMQQFMTTMMNTFNTLINQLSTLIQNLTKVLGQNSSNTR